MASDRSTGGQTKTCARQVRELQNLHSLKHSGVPGGDDSRAYPFVQCRYGGIRHMGCSTSLPSCILLGLGSLGALCFHLLPFSPPFVFLTISLMWLHHCLTALLYLYICVCQCQLFTDEGSHRLPKCLNQFFSV